MARIVATVAIGVLSGLVALARPAERPAQSDLDAFMASVLQHRDENWKKLQQYLLDERERIELRGTGAVPLWGDERTYTWYIRDGFFVRSPVTANGVTISEPDRRKYETEFLLRAQRRERGVEKPIEAEPAADGSTAAEPQPQPEPQNDPRDLGGLLAQRRQPQFIDTAYFLRFKFESGKYALVGRETIDGTETLRIEYYPERLFSRQQDAAARREAEGTRDRKRDVQTVMEQMMNKVAVVTLWVTPASRQIVKYTFENVSFDFLPIQLLFRITEARAVMTMGQPFKDVWLPRDVDMRVGGMAAIGTVDVRYQLDYFNYREAATSGRIVPATRP